jgi:DNA-binding transcriptional regulator YiaG
MNLVNVVVERKLNIVNVKNNMANPNKKQGFNIYIEEEFNIKVLDLYRNKAIEDENNSGILLNWYGKRLSILRLMYNKSTVEIAVYLKTSASKISLWEKNKFRPKESYISKLELLFEVSEGFFTKECVKFEINQQLILKEI